MTIRTLLISVLMTLVCANAGAAKKIAFPGGKCTLFRVTLKDKKGTPYSLSHPDIYLSEKALQRRAKQKIELDSTDLPINPYYIEEVQKQGVTTISKSKWNNTLLIRVGYDSNDGKIEQKVGNIEKKVRNIELLPFVKSVRRVYVVPDSIETDTCLKIEKDTTAINRGNAYGDALVQIKMLNGVKLHEAGYRGKGMTIAIIDGGFMNVDRMPLLKNVNILGARNFTFPATDNVYRELDHGTAVLSCMATNQPGRMIGTAPEASFWLLRSEFGPTESEAEEDYWAAAAEFADSVGVDIINSSLGYHDFDYKATSHTYRQLNGHTALISRTASMLADKGIVLTNSAGNDGENHWKKITVPADADNILTVGALQRDSMNALFSSVGNTVDGRIKPDVMALGHECALIKGNGQITRGNGTSFASPITCGMVACLWQALPHCTAKQIIKIVHESADRYEYPDNIFGYGIPDFWEAYIKGSGLNLME